ncbi:MAG: metal-dependent transcriptional regulator [Acholeplasmataceae bacterium]
MNRAEEDYIKAIYELDKEKKSQHVKLNELASHFGYTDQSVNEMIKRLAAKKLIKFYPYKGVILTKKGEEEAIRMIRSHRVWEVFLTKELGFSWEEVHEDAERLEHATSDHVLRRIYGYLGEPKYCQHGNPIPDFSNNIPKVSRLNLFDIGLNQAFRLTRVQDSKALLLFLNQEKIKLYDQMTVIAIDTFNQIVKISHNDEEKALSIQTAKRMFGEKND